ncbi:MAG TPA: pirin family protein [Terriglobia bacterium]|nr:pirin family protein [Terriglobia bacterium]
MIKVRRAEDRGHADRGWLNANFSFAFADYHDPEHMGFRVLRVLNDDRIAAGRGFGPHAHRDMEIVTYVLEGGLLHRDSTGEQHVLRPNEVQTMSAGSGIIHSEFNASETESVHSIQIWIETAKEDLPPSYQQIAFSPTEKRGRFRLLAGPELNPGEPATTINQDARIYVSEIEGGQTLKRAIPDNRYAWIQILSGGMEVNGLSLKQGDGAAVSSERELTFKAGDSAPSEFLLFDLP